MKTLLTILSILCLSNLQAQLPKLHIETTGTAKKQALLLPGFSCSGKVWDSTVSVLSRDYTCHVITFPGFAGQPPQPNPSLNNWVAALAQYMEAKNLKEVTVIGHSIGGIMALQLAAASPARVEKVVVVDALPALSALQNPNFRVNPTPDHGALVAQFTSRSDSAWRAQQETSAPMFTTRADKREELISWSMDSDRATMGTIYGQFQNGDYRDSLSTIKVPVLVLLEPFFKGVAQKVEAQYSGLSNKTLAYAPTGMHFVMWDAPEWYMTQLKSFLH